MDALKMMETWHKVCYAHTFCEDCPVAMECKFCEYQDFWVQDVGKPDLEKFVRTLEVIYYESLHV